MLRALVALLLVANGLFFAWSQGWLDRVTGIPAQGDREPQRLASQVRPELVQLTLPASAGASQAPMAPAPAASAPATASGPAGASAPASGTTAALVAALRASAASAPVPAPAATAVASGPPPSVAASRPAAGLPAGPVTAAASAAADACLETGPYTATELAAVEGAVRAALPAGTWAERKAEGTGEWMIYMGPYPDRDFMDRKKAELARIRGGVPQEEVNAPPELARGLSLGRFPTQAAANATLAQYRLRGIRTARVVRSGNGPPVVYLRVAKADAALAARVAAIKLPLAGRSFTACTGPR